MKTTLFIFFVLFPVIVQAELSFHSSFSGDYYLYKPEKHKPKHILVIAHGMYKKKELAKNVSKRFIKRWVSYAEEHKLIVISPVFDDSNFGTLTQGYGGYRNLLGKYEPADKFVNRLVDKYKSETTSASSQFLLYGHSAGGQFANRYTVTHPKRILKTVVSAAGRYTYPDKTIKWPYGAGDLNKTIKWDNGAIKNDVSIYKHLSDYALAASKITVVFGRKDTKRQGKRPGHIGRNRIEYAQSWAKSMNDNAKKFGMLGNIKVIIIDGIGHDSKRLTPYCANELFKNSS